jgi:hypothetical protein
MEKTKQAKVAERIRREKARQQQDIIDSLRRRVDLSDASNSTLRRTNSEIESAKSVALSEQRRLSTALRDATGELDSLKTTHTDLSRHFREISETALEQSNRLTYLTETVSRLKQENDDQREQIEARSARTRIEMHGAVIVVESKDTAV